MSICYSNPTSNRREETCRLGPLSNRSPGVIAIQSSSLRKAVPPGIESKFGPITPDVDTPAEKALPPGIEQNVDRGKLPGTKTVVP